MRVVHVIHSLEPGGAESVLVDLASVASAHDIEMSVMPIVRIRSTSILRGLRSAGVPVLPLDLGNRWDPRAFVRATDRMRAWEPDVVHTHLKHADIVGAAASRRLGRPMVSTLHVIEDLPGTVAGVKRRLGAAARVSTAARTVTVSEAQRRWYLSTFPAARPDTVVTVHNGVSDPARAAPDPARIRRELGLPPSALLAVQVGLLREGKGHRTLLEALAMLGDRPDLVLLVVGDGPLRAELEAAARGLGDRVRFLGYREDVPMIVAGADVVVQPSEFDALPTALIQALAAGRPIVACAVGGIPEIVSEAEGVLVPPRDAEALAAAIRALAEAPERRRALGEAARNRFERDFAADRWAGRLRDLYVDVVGASR